MTAPIDIKAAEQGVTRVFSLSLSAAEARALRDDPDAQRAALGSGGLSASGVEVFDIGDLGDLGLVGYLREGVDAREEDLSRDRARLSALEGWVMLVHSSAFGGAAQRLTPVPALTLIGTYSQTPPDTLPAALEAEAAQPYTGTPGAQMPPAPRSRAGSAVVLVLALLVIGVLWWALS